MIDDHGDEQSSSGGLRPYGSLILHHTCERNDQRLVKLITTLIILKDINDNPYNVAL